MSQVGWSKKQRKLAKDGGLVLMAFAVDGSELPAKDRMGRFEQTGPVPKELAKDLLTYVTKLWNVWEAGELEEGR